MAFVSGASAGASGADVSFSADASDGASGVGSS